MYRSRSFTLPNSAVYISVLGLVVAVHKSRTSSHLAKVHYVISVFLNGY